MRVRASLSSDFPGDFNLIGCFLFPFASSPFLQTDQAKSLSVEIRVGEANVSHMHRPRPLPPTYKVSKQHQKRSRVEVLVMPFIQSRVHHHS